MFVCEGVDQVGKGDAILNLSERLLENSIPVTYSSFPIYATPVGTLVRFSLIGLLKEFEFEKIQELKIRMALYALNRLEFMDVLLSNRDYKKTLIVLDRSPFSNAVTIGYGVMSLGKSAEDQDVKDLVDYALWLESFMIKKLSLTNSVVQMVSEDESWKNLRKEKGDMYEQGNVQKLSGEIYDLYQERAGKGWKKVVTKTKSGWRSREDISDEIYEFLLSRIEGVNEMSRSSMYKLRYEIGAEEILKNLYIGGTLPSGLLSSYLKALRSNDKDSMYRHGVDIGVRVGRTCQLVKIKNPRVRKEMGKIIKELPEIKSIMSGLINKDFSDKFCRALDD